METMIEKAFSGFQDDKNGPSVFLPYQETKYLKLKSGPVSI